MRPCPPALLPILLLVVPGVLLPARPAAAAPAEENLLANGGFEKGLDGWDVHNQSGTIAAEQDRKEKKTGRCAARITKTGGMAADYFAGAATDLPPGATVTVEAWVKGKELGNCWVKVFFLSAAGETLSEDVDLRMLRGTFPWTEVTGDFAVPDGTARCEVRLYLFLGGEAWLDGVSVALKERPPARPKGDAKPLDQRTRAWLDEHAIKVKTLDFAASGADLAPLAKRLAGVRIVQLGENTHGDGACFEAKARLVRFLHEELGFGVLAFESGLFECDRANALLAAGKGREALDASVFGIWRVSQVRPLFDYLAERAAGGAPLRLAGFDCRASGGLAKELLEQTAAFIGAAAPVPEGDLAALRRLDELMAEQGDSFAPPPGDREAGLAAWARVRALLDEHQEELAAARGSEEVAFFARVLDNWKAREEFEASKGVSSLGRHGSTNLRDAAMADNLKWLAEVRYPDQKIITWGATFHLAHGLEGVKTGGDPTFYAGCRNMGQSVHAAFGKECFTIGFAAFGGRAGSFAWQSDLEPPQDGSVEETLRRYGAPLLLVDFRARGGPFRKRLRMAPMSYARDMEAVWSDVLDAVFFIEEMTPAR